MMVRYTPETFHRVIRAMQASSGLSGAELSVLAGLHRDAVSKLLTARRAWPTLLTSCRLAGAAGWTRERLAAEIDRQAWPADVRAPRREQGWRSPQVKLQQEVML